MLIELVNVIFFCYALNAIMEKLLNQEHMYMLRYIWALTKDAAVNLKMNFLKTVRPVHLIDGHRHIEFRYWYGKKEHIFFVKKGRKRMTTPLMIFDGDTDVSDIISKYMGPDGTWPQILDVTPSMIGFQYLKTIKDGELVYIETDCPIKSKSD